MPVVRKHRAPKGALRQHCLRRNHGHDVGQKAPSAKRCIKTQKPPPAPPHTSRVRKHRAPKGALRPRMRRALDTLNMCVRKHRAPKGALRLEGVFHAWGEHFVGQRAPSAKRCIKTRALRRTSARHESSQKAPSAKRCIKTRAPHTSGPCRVPSESTERQKVH